MSLPDLDREPSVERLVCLALEEDVGTGDVTSLALVPEAAAVQAVIVARHRLVVSGAAVAGMVFHQLDPEIRVSTLVDDGCEADSGDAVMQLAGRARPILCGERTALNFMQRMSGIATLTRRFVDAVAAHGTTVLDTRKTTPGLRVLEKYAVRCGGGENHRMGLYDRVLVKDNHRRLWQDAQSGLGGAVERARREFPGIPVEVEVESEAELVSALDAAPEWVLLDNMTPALMRRCVAHRRAGCRFEASGGITLRNAAKIAATGVDAISLGCLTHSAPAADLSLEIA